VIARIASEFLRDSAKYFVAEHLTGRDTSKVEKALIEHSTYADTVEWSDELHFSHTPYRGCAPFEMERDCPLVGGARRCIVTAIANYTIRASDLTLSVEEREEAIKFLIHLVGDIHNPLHVGFEEDLGGNLIHLSDPVGKSLHNVWDYVLVNRKQVELGVYKESEEEDAEPWKLSNSLLDAFSDRKSVSRYIFNLQLEDVATEESATRFAGGLASRTARDFTCNVAYKDEKGAWIESEGSLSDEYMSSRSGAAMEMLKLAGIRLAEMLNVIARQYSVNKHEAEKARTSSPTGSNLLKGANPYEVLVLDFDFDPEEHLFVADNVDMLKLEGEKSEPVEAAEISSQEKKPNVSKNKKSKMRKKKKERSKTILFEGIDLESVVLIKRRGCYIVTGSALVLTSPDYFPFHVDPVTVRFPSSLDAVEFFFDVAHFGRRNYSDEVVARALMKIGNLPPATDVVHKNDYDDDNDEENSTPLLSFKRVRPEVAPIDGEVVVNPKKVVLQLNSLVDDCTSMSSSTCSSQPSKNKEKKLRKKEKDDWMQILGYVPSAEEQVEMQINKNKDRICGVGYRNLFFYIHKDSMEDKSAPLIKANKFNILGQEGSNVEEPNSILLVDTLIYDGEFSSKFGDLLTQAGNANAESCRSSLRKRLSLSEELHDIHLFLFGTDRDRAKSFRRVKYFVYQVTEQGTFSQVHWSIH
jgi:hypothetical protein